MREPFPLQWPEGWKRTVNLPRPVPCRGWQGFWTLTADVERQVVEQLR